jgi:hypothetical protein
VECDRPHQLVALFRLDLWSGRGDGGSHRLAAGCVVSIASASSI